MMMFLMWALAWADEYMLESTPYTQRTEAAQVQDAVQAQASAYTTRIVRRFRVGHGWEFVVLVEKIPTEAEAMALASDVQEKMGVNLAVFFLEDTSRDRSVVEPRIPETSVTVAEWLDRTRAAHGGPTGGATLLARAPVVHFVFSRELTIDGKKSSFRHEYWRDGTSRRLLVDSSGVGKDSLAVANISGGWLVVDNAVQSRDAGVIVNAADTFAPEAVLAVVVDAWHLLAAPEVSDFRVLEGSEGGIRLGLGTNKEIQGLSYIDIDSNTGRITRARYVTSGGAVEFVLKDYREVVGNLWIPFQVEMMRADGRTEIIKIESIEIMEHSPKGIYDKPTISTTSP